MARKLYVSRTMKSTKASILCMDIEQAEPMNVTVILPEILKDENVILKAARKAIDTDTVKAVAVVDFEPEYAMYRMPIEFFLANAEKVDVK